MRASSAPGPSDTTSEKGFLRGVVVSAMVAARGKVVPRLERRAVFQSRTEPANTGQLILGVFWPLWGGQRDRVHPRVALARGGCRSLPGVAGRKHQGSCPWNHLALPCCGSQGAVQARGPAGRAGSCGRPAMCLPLAAHKPGRGRGEAAGLSLTCPGLVSAPPIPCGLRRPWKGTPARGHGGVASEMCSWGERGEL